MNDVVLLEEFHLTLRVPESLPGDRVTVVAGVLGGSAFRGHLGLAVAALLAALDVAEVTFEIAR